VTVEDLMREKGMDVKKAFGEGGVFSLLDEDVLGQTNTPNE
jgi:hypothetical protein